MIIGSNKRLKQIDIEPHIHIRGSRIDKVETTKSLGLMIDETLIWNAQVDKITKKVNSGLSILRRLRDIVDNNIAFVNSERRLAKSRVDITQCQHGNVGKFLSLYFFLQYYKTNIKHFFPY